jgi:hypothetical protein
MKASNGYGFTKATTRRREGSTKQCLPRHFPHSLRRGTGAIATRAPRFWVRFQSPSPLRSGWNAPRCLVSPAIIFRNCWITCAAWAIGAFTGAPIIIIIATSDSPMLTSAHSPQNSATNGFPRTLCKHVYSVAMVIEFDQWLCLAAVFAAVASADLG